MHLTSSEIVLILIVEGSLLTFFGVTILLFKRMLNSWEEQRPRVASRKRKSAEPGKVKNLRKESEALSRNVAEDLRDKRERVAGLISSLDEKIRDMTTLVEKAEPGPLRVQEGRPGTPDEKTEVLALARTGCRIPDIARRLGRSKEEIQLILDLEKIAVN